MQDRFELLRERFAEIADLSAASAVLQWDQETMMPPQGCAARSNALATVQQEAHRRLVSDEVASLLDACEGWALSKGEDSFEAAFVRLARRDHGRAKKIPGDLVAELARATSLATEAWQSARARSDFGAFAPHLEKVVALNRRKAEALEVGTRLYDALLDEYEPGTTAAEAEAAFRPLREGLVPLVREILARPDAVSNALLSAECGEEGQFELCREVVTRIGYDFERGRLDRSAHPFSTSFASDDVRITTRVRKDWLPAALFGTIHECGHALYSQGVDRAFDRTPLSEGTSLGVHESQSRLWENLVGRGRPFCAWLLPLLRSRFPEAFGRCSTEEFYRAVNKAGPSLIRIEADEVTYNLHVLLRFELESALVEGRLKVADAPAAWNEKMAATLGLTPPDDAQGLLQDIHWAAGLIGYFPTYTLGNLMSAQFFAKAREALPGLDDRLARGEFAPLKGWLNANLHVHGRKYTAKQLLHRVAGGPLDAKPFLDYLRAKYAALYGFKP